MVTLYFLAIFPRPFFLFILPANTSYGLHQKRTETSHEDKAYLVVKKQPVPTQIYAIG